MAKKRYLRIRKLKPEMVEAYRNAHETMHEGPWKEQLQVLKEAGAEECIVYLYEDYSIILFVCDEIEESFEALGRDPRRKKWDDFMAPMFVELPDAEKTEGVPYLEKIFDMKEQINGVLTKF